MKKIYDISPQSPSNEVYIKKESPQKIELPKEESFKDITTWKEKSKKDIILKKHQTIELSKKISRNFDALEQEKNIFYKRKKNISLQKTSFQFSEYLSSCFWGFKKQYSRFWIIGFFVFFLVFWMLYTLFAKIVVENRVNAGYEKLLSIREGNLSFPEIQKNINNARFDFFLSRMIFSPFTLLPSEKIASVKHAIKGGSYLANGLDKTLELYSKTKQFTDKRWIRDIYFTQLFLNTYPEVQSISRYFKKWRDEYQKISWLPNEDLYEKKNNAVIGIDKLLSFSENYLKKFPEFLSLLWHDQRKRYLIVFQNADEIRPTGGFMWSMGLVDIFKGKIKLFEKKDVYAIEWDLKGAKYERLPAPKWISELTPVFWLRDANYYANTKDSSNSIKFFTDKAGLKIDGIIYINQNILLKFLELTGPVHFEQLWMDITHENFSEIMSLMVEAKVSKTSTLESPKRILFDFMEVFTKKLLSDAKYVDYLQLLMQEAQNRDVLMWSFNKKDNEFLRAMKLTGEIDYDASLDSIYPVYTSLSGNKSDRYMNYLYNHTVTKNKENCDYEITQNIKSSHNMWKKSRNRIQSLMKKYNLNTPNLFKIQWADRNRQYVRIILPENAQITPQKNMEIVDYGKRKGIEFFLTTPEQQASYYAFSYTLPNPSCKPYSFILYKQPGMKKFDVRLDINGKDFEYYGRDKDFYFEERK